MILSQDPDEKIRFLTKSVTRKRGIIMKKSLRKFCVSVICLSMMCNTIPMMTFAEKKEDIERLRRAYKSLDAEDRELIYLLYLCREPLTEKQAASVLHISQQAINKRKMRILRKMKSFWL